MIKEIVINVIDFIKKPEDFQLQGGKSRRIKFISYLFVINLIFSYSLILPVVLLVNDYINLGYKEYNFESLNVLLIFTFLIPFLEEIIFRYFLRYKGFITTIFSELKWGKNFPKVVYFSTFSFALMHLSNFSNDDALFFTAIPIIILPQILSGFILSFIRVRINFFYALIYHSLYNLTVFLIIPSLQEFISSLFS